VLLHVILHRPLGRALDAVLPWGLAMFFAAAAVFELRVGVAALPLALVLLGLAVVLVLPRLPSRRHAHAHTHEAPMILAPRFRSSGASERRREAC
jgi:hypothetical protein